MAVYPTDLLLLPIFMYSINSSCVLATFMDKSLINTPLSVLYLTSNLFLTSLAILINNIHRRSLTSSL